MKKKPGCIPLRALGKRIIIRFADHSIYDTAPVECELMGTVDKLNEKEIVLRWWSTFDGESEVPDISDDNNEVARVLQGTIIKWAFCTIKKWEQV